MEVQYTPTRFAGVQLAIGRFLRCSHLGRGFSGRYWGKFPLGYSLVAQKCSLVGWSNRVSGGDKGQIYRIEPCCYPPFALIY